MAARSIRMPHVDVDLRQYVHADRIHGQNAKNLIVCHETVSYNKPGLLDIVVPTKYLDEEGYGIHGLVDAEANSGWLYDANAIVYHAASRGVHGDGHVNTRGIGFELVSEVPLQPAAIRYGLWTKRTKQLDKLARWICWLNHELKIPLTYSDGRAPGVTTHWDVSQTYGVPHGHWDCWPKHKGGYFPVLWVIQRASNYVKWGGWE